MKNKLSLLFILILESFCLKSQNVLNVPSTYSTIQLAVSNAVSGDTVLVASGVYSGPVNYNGKNITIRSVSGANSTSITGNNANTIIIFGTGENSNAKLIGFTLMNGFTNNASFGGGVSCINSSPTIQNCIIKNCTAINGGAINCYGSCSPIIKNNTICYNNSSYPGPGIGGGGGIRFRNDSAISSTDIKSNPIIKQNNIYKNTALFNAGGIDFSGDLTTGIVSNNTIDSNIARYGGGIHLDTYSYPIIDSNKVSYNTTNQNGAGIGVGDNCYPILRYNKIFKNTCPGKGGGIQCYNSHPLIAYNLIYQNHSAFGAGIYNWTNSKATIQNNTIVKNIADTLGAGIGIDATANPFIINTIVWLNKKILTNSIPNNTQIEGLVDTLVYCNVQNGFLGVGNISGYPNFTDTLNNDFTINSSSNCIDAGEDSFTSSNVSLIIPFNNYFGIKPDIGYYEFNGSVNVYKNINVDTPLIVFPNPFTNKINVKNSLGNETFVLTNLLGRKVYEGKGITEQDFSNLNEGVYFLIVNSQYANTYQTLKLIKQ